MTGMLLPAACLHSLVWQMMDPLPLPRAGYMAGVVGGKFVLAGGSYWANGQKVWSDRTDWFDPAGGHWSPGPKMPAARSDAACVTLDADLYVFGGGAEGHVESSVWRLHDGKWSELDMHLPAARLYPVAARVNETIYVMGGLQRAGDYDSATRTVWSWNRQNGWTELPPMPGHARFSEAVAVVEGRIVIAGGATAIKGSVHNLSDVWVFDPHAGTWSALAPLPSARRASAALGWGSKLVLFGGYSDDFSSEILCVDLRSGKTVSAGVLPHALADAKFFRVGNRIVTAGGECGPKLRSPWTLETTVETNGAKIL